MKKTVKLKLLTVVKREHQLKVIVESVLCTVWFHECTQGSQTSLVASLCPVHTRLLVNDLMVAVLYASTKVSVSWLLPGFAW